MKNVIKALLVAWLIPAVALADRPEGEIVTFYLTDHLGTPVVAMDEAGDVLWTREYSAFGEALENEDEVQVGYTGHEFVPESGLSYMEARWYNPVIGRFLQPDPVGFIDSNTLSFNRYLYVNNSPYVAQDPDGEYLEIALEIASISMSITSAINNFSQGNIKEGLMDVAFAAVDGVLMAVPVAPGGTGIIRAGMKNADVNPQVIVGDVTPLARACSFAAGTLVATPTGFVAIEALERGDQVLARDENTGVMAYKHILDAYSHHHDDGMQLTVVTPEGGRETITTTQEHPFYVSDLGFVPAGKLVVGQSLVNADSQHVLVESVDLEPILIEAYNYTVEDFQTYYVGSSRLWIHNACDPGGGLAGLTNSQQRAIRGLERQIEQHEKKLKDYIENPGAHDNRGHLRNARNAEQRQHIVDRRIESLRHQIRNFRRQIDRIKSGDQSVPER